MAGKVSSKLQEAHYTTYKNSKKWEKNRIRKLEAALKRNPNNEQIKEAIKNVKYRRKTPTTPQWNATQIQVAKLFKLFVGRFDKNIFSTNEKTASAAYATLKYSGPSVEKSKVSFALGARAHNGKGDLVWTS